MSLADLARTDLPLNRKERFYTGTVFPMIVARDGFRHIRHFTALIPGYHDVPIMLDSGEVNIQFFSEYSLAESIFGEDRRRFPDPPATKETPDIVILISARPKTLIAVEAKMFDNPSNHELREQMDDQERTILAYLRGSLRIESIYHVALLPRKLHLRTGSFGHPVVTWDDLLSTYRTVYGADYWLEALQIALDTYDDRVARGPVYGLNCDAKMTGWAIYDGYKSGTLAAKTMGRSGGLQGDRLSADIGSGQWKRQEYETRGDERPVNRNWFAVRDFVTRIEGGDKGAACP